MNPILPFVCLAAQSPAPQAELHPQSAILYVEVPDVAAMLAAYENAPTVQLCRDPKVLGPLHELLKGVGFDLEAAFSGAGEFLGLPPAQAQAPIASLIERMRSASSASLSFTFLPSTDTLELQNMGHAMEEMTQLRGLVEDWRDDHDGSLPESVEIIELSEELKSDPWGTAYVLRSSADGEDCVIVTLGADRAPGGGGAGTDLSTESEEDFGKAIGSMFLSRIGVLAVCDFASPAKAVEASKYLRELAQKAGLAPRASQELALGGQKCQLDSWAIEALEGISLWTVAADRRVVFGGGVTSPEAFTGLLAKRTPSLAAMPSYKQLSTKLPEAKGATVAKLFMQSEGLLELMMQTGERNEAMAEMLKRSGSASFLRMQLTGDRFLTESLTVPTSKDYFGKSMGRTPMPSDLRACVPADAIAFYAASIDGAALYEEILMALRAEPEAGDIDARMRELESEHGIHLQRDIFDSLGDGMVAYMLPIQGMLPAGALIVDVEDVEPFTRGMQALFDLLNQHASAEMSVKYKPYKVKGGVEVPMWTIDLAESGGGGPFGGAMMLNPTFAIVGKRALVTLQTVRARKEIKRLLGEEENAAHPLWSAPAQPPADATTVGYMDWGTLFNGIYKQVRMVAGIAAASGESGFDSSKLPEADAITRFYKPTIVWTKAVEIGQYSHWESSFGPETWLGLAALGGVVAVGIQELREHPSPPPTESEERTVEVRKSSTVEPPLPPVPPKPLGSREATVTSARLASLRTAIAVYEAEKGGPPAKLEELLIPTASFPQGFLKERTLPVDGWGRAFGYARDGGGSYRLWSCGPDGVDQKGAGDDLDSR